MCIFDLLTVTCSTDDWWDEWVWMSVCGRDKAMHWIFFFSPKQRWTNFHRKEFFFFLKRSNCYIFLYSSSGLLVCSTGFNLTIESLIVTHQLQVETALTLASSLNGECVCEWMIQCDSACVCHYPVLAGRPHVPPCYVTAQRINKSGLKGLRSCLSVFLSQIPQTFLLQSLLKKKSS